MKKFLISLLLMLPLSFAAQAQQKIGVVNTAAAMEALPDVKAATTRVQELAKSFDAEIKRKKQPHTLDSDFRACFLGCISRRLLHSPALKRREIKQQCKYDKKQNRCSNRNSEPF